MGPKKFYPLLIFVIITLVLSSVVSALDSWPMFRRDLQNTAYTNLTGDLDEVTEAWRYLFVNGIYSSPAVGDLDNDGDLEIVIGCEDGKLYVIDDKGNKIWEFTTSEGIHSSPALVDLNGDDELEIVFGTRDGRVLALDNKGNIFWSFDAYTTFRSSPAIFDIDKDNNPEVIIGGENGLVYCLDGESGILEWSFESGVGAFSSPAVGDLNSNGESMVVFGSQDGVVYVLYSNGTEAWSYNTTGQVYSSPALVDLDGDGKMEIVIGSDSGYVYKLRNNELLWEQSLGGSIQSSPTFADLDGDGIRDVIIGATIEEYLHGKIKTDEINKLYALRGTDGAELWSFGIDGWPIFSSPVSGDINRDGSPEIIFGTTNGKFYALDKNGNQLWTYKKGTGLYSSPILVDLNNDGDLEILVGFYYSNELVVLKALKKPDLLISSVTLSDYYPEQGDEVSISVDVFNDGQEVAEGVEVTIYRRSAVLDHEIGRINITQVGVGEYQRANTIWVAELPETRLGIYAVVDENNIINESDETNNDAYKPMGEDLVLTNMSTSSEIFGDGEEIEIQAMAINKGNQKVENVVVNLILKNITEEKVVGQRTISEIQARDNASITFTWGYERSPENRFLILRIDPENEFDEVDEENNEVSLEIPGAAIEVEPPPPPSTTKKPQQGRDPTIAIVLLVAVFIILWKKGIFKKLKKRGLKPKPKEAEKKELVPEQKEGEQEEIEPEELPITEEQLNQTPLDEPIESGGTQPDSTSPSGSQETTAAIPAVKPSVDQVLNNLVQKVQQTGGEVEKPVEESESPPKETEEPKEVEKPEKKEEKPKAKKEEKPKDDDTIIL